MVAKAAELLQGLQAPAKEQRLQSLKKVKNSVIGNKQRKEVFIKAGAVKQVIDLLSGADSDTELLVQSAATLGSLVCGNSRNGADQALRLRGLDTVLGHLVGSRDQRVTEAAVRCIKMMCQAVPVPSQSILAPSVLRVLSDLLSTHPDPALVDTVSQILVTCCHGHTEQQALVDAGVLTTLIQRLPSLAPRHTTYSLALLTRLLTANTTTTAPTHPVHVLRTHTDIVDILLAQLRDGTALAQALAANCLCVLATAVVPPMPVVQPAAQPPPAAAASEAAPGRYSPPPPALADMLEGTARAYQAYQTLAGLLTEAPPAALLSPMIMRVGTAPPGAAVAAVGGGGGAAGASGIRAAASNLAAVPSGAQRVLIFNRAALPPIGASAVSSQTSSGAATGAAAAANTANTATVRLSVSRRNSSGDLSGRRVAGGSAAGRGERTSEPGGSAGGSAAAATAPLPQPRRVDLCTDADIMPVDGDACMSGSEAAHSSLPEELIDKLAASYPPTLSVTLRLLGDEQAAEVAGATLAALIEETSLVPQLVSTASIVKQLCQLITQHMPTQPTHTNNHTHSQCADMQSQQGVSSVLSLNGCALVCWRTHEAWLRCLGALCMAHEDARKSILDTEVMTRITYALSHWAPTVRAAAAMCILAYTRYVKSLRPGPVPLDPLTLTQALCAALQDKDVTVQINVCAALCNMVLEVSSAKEAVVEAGAIDTLSALTGSPHATVRLYSSWALRNLFYKSNGSVKRALMQALHWPRMRALLSDPSDAVCEQAICILRNLCMDAADHIASAYEWGGADLLAALEEKLDPSRPVPAVLRVHALYTLVNSLTGPESVKELVMSSNIPALVCHHMKATAEQEVRLPAVWCIINLTWSPSATGASSVPPPRASTPSASGGAAVPGAAGASADGALQARLRRLRALGCHECLQPLLTDTDTDVRDAARQAMEFIRSEAGSLLDD